MKQKNKKGRSKKEQYQTTQEIASLAAKLMAEEGVNDYLAAKNRAVKKLHLSGNTSLPKNIEIHQQLATHLKLFDPEGLVARQKHFRELTIQLMELLETFHPLAVGPVVDGVITKHSQLQIHLFAGTLEDVTVVLINKDIPYNLTEQEIKFSDSNSSSRPGFNFILEDVSVNLCVFSEKDRRVTPLSPVTGMAEVRMDANSINVCIN